MTWYDLHPEVWTALMNTVLVQVLPIALVISFLIMAAGAITGRK